MLMKRKENCQYHCNMTPTIKGNNNLQKGEAFQKGTGLGCMPQSKKPAGKIAVELTEDV